MITEVEQILNEISKIHEKKNADYASQTNQFENFERSAELISWFKNDEDKAFVALIATKLARLATLLSKGGIPNNESIEDSFLDLDTYCILWHGYYKRINHKEKDHLLKTNPLGYVSPIFSMSGSGDATRIENNVIFGNKIEEVEKYQCKQCGAQFSYAPHVAVELATNRQLLFDTKRCVDDYTRTRNGFAIEYATVHNGTT